VNARGRVPVDRVNTSAAVPPVGTARIRSPHLSQEPRRTLTPRERPPAGTCSTSAEHPPDHHERGRAAMHDHWPRTPDEDADWEQWERELEPEPVPA
jgi:hypothetical protein